jgi:hypothetical protein
MGLKRQECASKFGRIGDREFTCRIELRILGDRLFRVNKNNQSIRTCLGYPAHIVSSFHLNVPPFPRFGFAQGMLVQSAVNTAIGQILPLEGHGADWKARRLKHFSHCLARGEVPAQTVNAATRGRRG